MIIKKWITFCFRDLCLFWDWHIRDIQFSRILHLS